MVQESSETTTRRGFLDRLLAFSVLAWLASILYPIVRYLKPLPQVGPGGPLKLTSEQRAKLEREKMLIVRVNNQRVIVFVDTKNKIKALSAKCTHEGCTVKWMPSDQVIWCPCHNGRFNEDGRVIAGPPPRPLAQYTVDHQVDGTLVVSEEGKA